MTSTSFRGIQVVIAVAVLMTPGCSSDGPTAPLPGNIRVSVTTTGGDPDLDGYQIVLDSNPGLAVPLNSTTMLPNISAAAHTVALQGVADNCTVTGTLPLTLAVPEGATADVAFNVVCYATGFEVSVHVTGLDSPRQFQVQVANLPLGLLPVNGSMLTSRLTPGSYAIWLSSSRENCTVTGGNPIVVEVSSRVVTQAVFEVACTALERAEKIAFVERFRGVDRITWVDPDGSNLVTLATGFSPTWSPDGRSLLFSTTFCDDYYYYYCIGGLALIDPENDTNQQLTTDGGQEPSWSPDGGHIALVRVNYAGNRVLTTIRSDGTGPIQFSIPGVIGVSHPTWSPDSQRIAFSCYWQAPLQYDLCIIKTDGTGLQRLTNNAAVELSPAWSPDGNTIAFVTYGTGGQPQIVTMNTTGGNITPLTEGLDPAWSPQGSKIVFAGSDGLFTINPDGSGRARLTTGEHHDPAWRP